MTECSLTLSRPYAQAAFDFAFEHKTLDKWEFMLFSAKSIIQDVMVKKVLSNVDCIEPFKLSEILISIGSHNFNCFFQNFIRVMAEYKRLSLLPVVFEQFLSFRRDCELVTEIKIVTANVLKNDQLLKIISFMEKRLLRKVNVTINLDYSIIGGFVIYFNDVVIDSSIRSRIERLKNGILKV
ncbi:F0F1 ATP synthase subunit delta [Blochmannia endosymbiont of Polyrhachis (Hedomyrma) turneri]|uniref:F0F1 ATP synthase subunit delta n=1 Tax=Blochmannia endosymbiont of Polyrhachis (Hedomyrma) turneri TaxID=1505596 RepID=UPI00061A6503|nr:F0F1 ATP synthase subunit delta [Blochmannia endosymbiont of Polyrhachis (Hedomyrma) turneri]AKC59601.1 ATP synthase subunit delta [Blochmannia endosymbiont of Polyrhachis (Hedomyrma) turneri]